MEKSAFPLKTDHGMAAAGKIKSSLKNRNKHKKPMLSFSKSTARSNFG